MPALDEVQNFKTRKHRVEVKVSYSRTHLHILDFVYSSVLKFEHPESRRAWFLSSTVESHRLPVSDLPPNIQASQSWQGCSAMAPGAADPPESLSAREASEQVKSVAPESKSAPGRNLTQLRVHFRRSCVSFGTLPPWRG